MPRRFCLIAFLSLMPAKAQCESVTSVGRLAHIDGISRIITLADGSTFHVNKRVKMSSRTVGESVVITFRSSAKGREVTKLRRAPVEVESVRTIETVVVAPNHRN